MTVVVPIAAQATVVRERYAHLLAPLPERRDPAVTAAFDAARDRVLGRTRPQCPQLTLDDLYTR